MPWDKSLKLSLNSDSTGYFYTGDIVTGTVNLDLSKDQTIESIDLIVTGTSRARWTRSAPTFPHIKIYSEKKRVLFIKTPNIFGNFKRGNVIPAGVYNYPFHFALPQDLPSTFKSSVAKVYYTIKIKSKPKYKIKKAFPFNVLANVNINHMNEMLMPWTNDFSRTFKQPSEKVAIYLKTFKGIGLRQTIPFEIILHNAKNIRISELNVALVQKVHYTVSSGWATDEKKICKVKIINIGKSISEINTLFMEIPQVSPSSIHMAEPMIDISYVFRVEVCFPFHFNHHEDLPVTIASVPVIHHDF